MLTPILSECVPESQTIPGGFMLNAPTPTRAVAPDIPLLLVRFS